jgi:hypothetical protein
MAPGASLVWHILIRQSGKSYVFDFIEIYAAAGLSEIVIILHG